MEFLLTVCILVCTACLSTEAVPLDARARRQQRDSGDTFILMPGVNMRSFVEEPLKSSEHPVSPPLLFGDSFRFEKSIPISFGNENEAQAEDKTELIPIFPQNGSDTVVEEGSGVVPNTVQFPSERPIDQTPNPTTVTEDEGSGDSFHFPSQIIVNLKSEGDAANDEKGGTCQLDAGTLTFNGSCFTLLGRNSCPKDHWFVLNSDSNEAECVPRPCPFGQLKYEDRCVDIADETVCKDGQILYVDFNGYVHCDCIPNFFYDPWSGKCYAQGDRGYCNFGEHLSINETGFVNCKRNPCLMNGFILHEKSERCFRKMFRGFCQIELLVHFNNMTAECPAVASHSIFDLPTTRSCVGGSLRDYGGNCRRSYRVPTVKSYPTIYGGCPGRFVQDTRGACRKTQRLFG